MKIAGMYGPYSLNEIDVVQSSYTGVYALSKNGRTVHYVGRSDSDVQGS